MKSRPSFEENPIEPVEASDGAPAAMVKVPAHQLALIGPGILLNRVVKDQHVVVMLNRPDISAQIKISIFPLASLSGGGWS